MALTTSSKYKEADAVWEIELTGEVDISNASALRSCLDQAYKESRGDILLNLSDLTYIDSTGLGVIIGAHGRMQEKGNRVFISNPRDNIKKLLAITCLDKIFCEMQ